MSAVRLRIAPCWDPSPEEVRERAALPTQAYRERAADDLERAWRERVERNIRARGVRRALEFVGGER